MCTPHRSNWNRSHTPQQQCRQIRRKRYFRRRDLTVQIREDQTTRESQSLCIDNLGAENVEHGVEREGGFVGGDFVLGCVFAAYAVELDADGGSWGCLLGGSSKGERGKEEGGCESEECGLHVLFDLGNCGNDDLCRDCAITWRKYMRGLILDLK